MVITQDVVLCTPLARRAGEGKEAARWKMHVRNREISAAIYMTRGLGRIDRLLRTTGARLGW